LNESKDVKGSEDRIEKALQRLRPGLTADGFELRLDSINSDRSVSVALDAKPNACMDCLVPDQLLIGMLEQAIRKEDPTITRVILNKNRLSDNDVNRV
jgi:Fe-S cluster biogenesis protein NfuA